MIGTADIEAFAAAAQEAALDHTLWPGVLEQFGRAAGGVGAVMFSIGPTLELGPFSSPDLDESNRDYIRHGWSERDERLKAVPTIIRTGVAVDQDFISPDEMKRSAYYQEFLAKHDLQWFGTLGFWPGSELWVLSIQRTSRQGSFEADEMRRLALLGGPLSDAATLTKQIGLSRILGMTDGLDLIGQPCVLMTDRGRVLAINASGEALIGGMVDPRQGALTFPHDDSQTRFDTALASVLRGKLDRGKRAAVEIRDRNGRDLSIRIVGLQGLARYSFTGARALLLIDLVQFPARTFEQRVAAAYGLTRGEARLARSLEQGFSLSDAAQQLGIAYETARSRLKAIYVKTQTNRQGQLIALLSRLPT